MVVTQLTEKFQNQKEFKEQIAAIKDSTGKVKWKILGFSSHKLTLAETNYTTFELEL